MFHIPAGQIHTFTQALVEKRIIAVTVQQFRKSASVFRGFEQSLDFKFTQTSIVDIHFTTLPMKLI